MKLKQRRTQIAMIRNCLAALLLLPGLLLPGFACGQIVIDFDELQPPDQGNGDFYFDGYGATASAGSWASQNTEFNTNMFGPGWSYSAVNDTMTAGFTNQWAAITGTDFSGSGNYVLANSFAASGAILNLPSGLRAESMVVTNSTFAFLSMLKGDNFAKQFGGDSGNDPDWFRVIFHGFKELDGMGTPTGNQEFLLADYRFEDNRLDYIVDTWTLVDLSNLGPARSIGVQFESSDVGKFGINTPTYVAIDQLFLVPDVVLLGDVNLDGVVNLLDVTPFVELLTSGEYLEEADTNLDGLVNLLDVQPFIDLLSG